jgi:hypothetical protein
MQLHPHADWSQIVDLAARYHRQLLPVKQALIAKVIGDQLHSQTLKPAWRDRIAQKAGEVNLIGHW